MAEAASQLLLPLIQRLHRLAELAERVRQRLRRLRAAPDGEEGEEEEEHDNEQRRRPDGERESQGIVEVKLTHQRRPNSFSISASFSST